MKKCYAYSQNQFDDMMLQYGWYSYQDMPSNIAIISICAPWNEYTDHWFKESGKNVLNIDFDDLSPTQWWDKDYYDEAQLSDNQDDYFIYNEIEDGIVVKSYQAMDYNDAYTTAKFIEEHKDCDFIIHCFAGMSRSQGIVRYILDTYDGFEDNPDNPCYTPNYHVVRMLKRAYRHENIENN